SCEVLSYEAPFGVGYLVAQLLSEPPAVRGPRAGSPRGVVDATGSSDTSASGVQSTDFSRALPTLARHAIETFVRDGTIIDAGPPAIPTGRDSDKTSDLLSVRAGCFVCIKTDGGYLRGCIGTIDPDKGTLAEEIITNAINA